MKNKKKTKIQNNDDVELVQWNRRHFMANIHMKKVNFIASITSELHSNHI